MCSWGLARPEPPTSFNPQDQSRKRILQKKGPSAKPGPVTGYSRSLRLVEDFHLLDQRHARHTKRPPHLRGAEVAGELAERYETPLPQLTDEVATLSDRVDEHLMKMGAVWK